MRGKLTDKVQDIAKAHIKRTIDKTELRLIPYIQYIMVNEQKIEIAKVNEEEREILKKWKKAGYVEGGASGLSITKEFWDYMCDIMFEAYVSNSDL